MSSAALLLMAWIFLGAELGLRDAFALGSLHVAPSFMFCLLTYIAMFSPGPRPTWIALFLGLLMDLTFRIPLRDGAGTATIIGPYALSYVLSVQLVTTLRGIVIKRNPLTMGFLAMLGSIVCHVVLVGIFSIRLMFGDAISFGTPPSQELLARLGSAAYTGVLGTILALVLFPLAPIMGLGVAQRKR